MSNVFRLDADQALTAATCWLGPLGNRSKGAAGRRLIEQGRRQEGAPKVWVLFFVAPIGRSVWPPHLAPDQARERAYPAVISADRMAIRPAGNTLPLRLARCPMAAASTTTEGCSAPNPL